MSNEDERLDKLFGMMREEISNLSSDGEGASQPGIRIKGNSANINFGTQLTIGERPESLKLAKAQRIKLNAVVAEVAKKCGVSEAFLWTEVIHVKLGVTSINEITRDKYPLALEILDAFRSDRREQRTRQELIDKTREIAHAKGITGELRKFCIREFGEQRLDPLERASILRALAFVDDYHRQPASSEAPAPTPKSAPIQIRELVVSYPWQFGLVFALGALMGKMV